MKPVSPIVNGLEPYEVPIGSTSDAEPLKVLRSPEGRFFMRWSLTDEERKQIAEGADVYVTLWTGNQGMSPLAVQVMRPDIDPQIIKDGLDLDDDLKLRMLQGDVAEANHALAGRVEALGRFQAVVIQKLNDRNHKPEGVVADAGNKGNDDQGTDA